MQPRVLVPLSDLDLPDDVPVAVYTGTEDLDLSAVELYVAPYTGAGLDAIARMPSLRAVQVLSAGYDSVLPHLPEEVALHNGRGLHDASTAEHAVALMLAAQRELPRCRDDQRAGRWVDEHTASLADSCIVIVGYGSIGAALEARLLPFEVDVVRVARRARPDDGVHGVDELDDLLPSADIVCLVTPLSEGTRGMFDARRLALMADGALLVNVGRGPVVDTDALVAETGRIRAALDVTDPEPLPPDHPLWSAPGVIITPHIAGGSATFLPRARRFVVEQVRRFADGRPLENLVEL